MTHRDTETQRHTQRHTHTDTHTHTVPVFKPYGKSSLVFRSYLKGLGATIHKQYSCSILFDV